MSFGPNASFAAAGEATLGLDSILEHPEDSVAGEARFTEEEQVPEFRLPSIAIKVRFSIHPIPPAGFDLTTVAPAR
jgi:hypothetical protein